MAARILPLELGLPCIGEPPYYLVQRMERRGTGVLELGLYYLVQRRAGGRKEEKRRSRRSRPFSSLLVFFLHSSFFISLFTRHFPLHFSFFFFPHPLVLGLLDFYLESASSPPPSVLLPSSAPDSTAAPLYTAARAPRIKILAAIFRKFYPKPKN